MAVVAAAMLTSASARAQPPDAPPVEPVADEGAPEDADPRAPTPEAVEAARQHYRRGTTLYQEGDYKLALIEFEKAYQKAPNYRVLYNIGQVNIQLNNYAAALSTLTRYLAEGKDEVPEDRRAAIEAELPQLRARTATITITSNVLGAEVLIDGVPCGWTPVEDLVIDAGAHNITLNLEGRSTSEYVTLAGGETQVLEVALRGVSEPAPRVVVPPPPAPVVLPPPSPPPLVKDERPVESPVPVGMIVGWSVTGSLVAAMIGTGVKALGAQQALAEVRDRETTNAELDAASARAVRWSVATDVLLGASLVAAGVSIYLSIDAVGDDVALRLGPSQLGLSGRF
ncbi:MAG: PEGA domain-containing protein [Myxococcales bacterium]|nr:PEGA domain-containing protein [Myxococcales bacterium]